MARSRASVAMPMMRVSVRFNSNVENNKETPSDDNKHDETVKKSAADASEGATTELRKFDADEYDDWEPKTAKEKVSYYSQIAFTLGLLGLGAGCVYVFIKEVNPFGRSPQSIFDQAVDRLIIKDEVNIVYCCSHSL